MSMREDAVSRFQSRLYQHIKNMERVSKVVMKVGMSVNRDRNFQFKGKDGRGIESRSRRQIGGVFVTGKESC